MEFNELIKKRYSCRKFTAEPVSAADIEKLLAAARVAPTAVNKQPQRLLVLQSPESLARLKDCTKYTFDAPLCIAVCYNRDEAWVRPIDQDNSGLVDASIVATHLMLAVHNLGLGATWVGFFDAEKFSRIYQLPKNIVPVALFPIGHPAEDARPAPHHGERRELAETVVYEHF